MATFGAASGSNPELAPVAAKIAEWPDESLAEAVAAWLESVEPLYLYFDEYGRMAGEGNVRELLSMRAGGQAITSANKTFLALIDEAKIDLDDLSSHDYNALRNRLESASIRISEELYSYWSQNQNSGIDFDHTSFAVHDLMASAHELRRRVGVAPVMGEAGDLFRFLALRVGPDGTEANLELIDPIGDDGFLSRFLAAHGEGPHHITFDESDAGSKAQ